MNNPQLNTSIHLLSFNSWSIPVKFRFKPLLPSKLQLGALRKARDFCSIPWKKLCSANEMGYSIWNPHPLCGWFWNSSQFFHLKRIPNPANFHTLSKKILKFHLKMTVEDYGIPAKKLLLMQQIPAGIYGTISVQE